MLLFVECYPFSLQNGVIKGNINDIGSKRAFRCTDGYSETSGKRVSICQLSGRWDHEPNGKLINGKCPQCFDFDMLYIGFWFFMITQIHIFCFNSVSAWKCVFRLRFIPSHAYPDMMIHYALVSLYPF